MVEASPAAPQPDSPAPSPAEVTRLLHEWRAGDPEALSRLIPLVHSELKRIASGCMMRERPEHTLQTTALVNEFYLRLSGARDTRWTDRAHFYAVAAQLMRRVLVEHARGRDTQKRGRGGAGRIALEAVASQAMASADAEAGSGPVDVLDLHEALDRLAAFDAPKACIIELRYFGGLTLDEVGQVMGLSRKQVWRDSRIALAWLLRALGPEHSRDA